MKFEEDIFLRLDPTSEVGLILTELLKEENKDGIGYWDLQAIGGKKRSPHLLEQLAKQVDNLSVIQVPNSGNGARKAKYINVGGRTVTIDKAEFSGSADNQQTASNSDISNAKVHYIWPDAPRIGKLDPRFVKPGWYHDLSKIVQCGYHISLMGPPGVGKDTAIAQLAAELSQPLIVVNCSSGIRNRHLVGTPEMVNGTTFFNVSEVASAIVNGWWVVFNEVNMSDPDVMVFLNSITEMPFTVNIHGKSFQVHPNTRIFINYNYGLVGTKPINQATKSRFFPFQIPMLTRGQFEKRLISHGASEIESNQLNSIITFCLNMWKAHTDNRIRFQCTFRDAKRAVDALNCDIAETAKDAISKAILPIIDNPVEKKVAIQCLNDIR